MDQCKVCGKKVKRLSIHITKSLNHPSVKEYYDTYCLINESEKICNYKNCSNLVNFSSVQNGYNKYCSSACCNKEKANDPNWRKKNSDSQKIAQNDLKVLKRSRESAINQWKNLDIRNRTLKTLRETMSTDFVRMKMSRSAKQKFKNPEFKKKFNEMRKSLWEDNNFRKKFKEAHQTILSRANHSRASKKHWKNEKFRNSMIQFLRSDAHRNYMSELVTAKIISGKWNPHGGCYKHGYFYTSKLKKRLFYRSSLELIVFQKLEKDNNVKWFDSEPFRIPYININGVKKFYIPDILICFLDGHKELVEIKPDIFLNDDTVQLKIQAMKIYCIKNNMICNIMLESDILKGEKVL